METTISLGFAIVGTVELIKRLFDRDFRSSAIILGAAIVGGITGAYLHIPVITGVILGLQGSGLVTAAQKFGGK